MHISRRSILSFPFAGALMLRAQDTPAAPTEATGETPLFRTSVSLIRVDAQVKTRDGGDIGGLNETDFVVYDEDVPQNFAHFGRESEPIDVLLALDVSASMRKSLSRMSEKASEALGQLRAGDRVGVLLFATRSRLMQPLTTEIGSVPAKVTSSIFKDTLGQSTLVNEALAEAAHYLKSMRREGRRTIVVVTDNEVARDAMSDDQVLRELQSADAVLNAILLGQETESQPRQGTMMYRNPANTPPDVLRFVKATGGDVMAGEDPAGALRRVIQSATTRYSLQYAAPPGTPGSFRRIRVELSPEAARQYPNAVVQARSGYNVAP